MIVSDGATTSIIAIANTPYTPVDELDPPLQAEVGIVSPPMACDGIDNSKEIAGKYCLVQRGGCGYTTKYAYCVAAGAVALVVVNRDDTFPEIGANGLRSDIPFIMTTATDGQYIAELVASSNGIVTLTVGSSVPRQGVDHGAPTVAFDISSGSEIDIGSTDFDYIEAATVSSSNVLYAAAVTNTSMSYSVNVTNIADDGQFDILSA